MDADPPTPPVVQVAAPRRSSAAIAVKRAVQTVFFILATPLFFGYAIGALVWGRDRSFLNSSEWLAGAPGMIGVYIRQAFYQRTLARCGADCYVGWLSTFSMRQASLGEGVYIGRRCSIGFADLGGRVMLADGVQILSGGREHEIVADSAGVHQEGAQTFRRLSIGEGAWIGTGAIVMADVGAGSVIGAGAVVTRAIPARCVAVGVPARVIRRLQAEA